MFKGHNSIGHVWDGGDEYQRLQQRDIAYRIAQERRNAAYRKSINDTQKQEEDTMSVALWCDKGDHAFSKNDPNRQHFTQTQTVEVPTGNSYGRTTYQDRQEVQTEMDICGPCWRKSNLFQPDENAPKALNESELEAAKAEAAMWRAKYDATDKASFGPEYNNERTDEWQRSHNKLD